MLFSQPDRQHLRLIYAEQEPLRPAPFVASDILSRGFETCIMSVGKWKILAYVASYLPIITVLSFLHKNNVWYEGSISLNIHSSVAKLNRISCEFDTKTRS